MTNKTWTERRIFTSNDQIATIQPNDTMNGIVLKTSEIDGKSESRLYLTYQEAKDLSEQLSEFIKSQEI